MGEKRMHWIETEPLPKACVGCREEECYNCDTAGERWTLSAEDEARLLATKPTKSRSRRITAALQE